MKACFKSNFFWTKVLPNVFYSLLIASLVLPFSTLAVQRIVVAVVLLSIPLLNLYLKKNWISITFGFVTFLILLLLLSAVLSEHSEFPNGASYDALLLLICGLVLCLSAMAMSVLLCIPFKRKLQPVAAIQ